MSTSPKDLVAFLRDYSSEYIGTFLEILIRPSRLVRLVPDRPADLPGPVLSAEATKLPSFDSATTVFVAMSIAIGFSIGTLIPDRETFLKMHLVMINLSILWLLWSGVTHRICKSFGGTRPFEHTAMITIRVFAAGYVVSNFVTMFVTTLGRTYTALELGEFGQVVLYFATQVIFLLVYIPAATGALHRLPRSGRYTAGALSAVVCVFVGAPMYIIGGC